LAEVASWRSASRTHNETLSVAAMRVSNPDFSASLARIDRLRIVFDCRMANQTVIISSTIPPRAMDISFNCPHCGQHLSVEERGAGTLVNCPNCNQQIEVPRRAAPVNRIVAKESEAAAGGQPFQFREIPKRPFLTRVFGGPQISDAETAVENLIAD
jgi:predicted RNA-binding Zn-ribbon protein involved in translation (DUF1610 family)